MVPAGVAVQYLSLIHIYIDILNEIGGDKIAQHTIAVQQEGATVYEGESFTFKGYEALPEGYLALPFVMFAQAISLLNSCLLYTSPSRKTRESWSRGRDPSRASAQ